MQDAEGYLALAYRMVRAARFPIVSEVVTARLAGMEIELPFAAYVEALVGVIGHVDRAVPLLDYCLCLLMPGERKSVEPMAAVYACASRTATSGSRT